MKNKKAEATEKPTSSRRDFLKKATVGAAAAGAAAALPTIHVAQAPIV